MGGLPRRSELPLGGRPQGACPGSSRRERDDHATAGPVEPRRQDAAGRSRRPVRSRLRLRRRRRGRARCAGCGPGSDPDHLGNAALGERRQESERDAHPHRGLHELHACDRVAVLGTLHGLPVRAVLLDLERAEPPALPEPAVRRAGPLGRAERTTQGSPLPDTAASRPGTRERRSRSARPPPAGATSQRGSGRRTRRASSPSSSRRPTRG